MNTAGETSRRSGCPICGIGPVVYDIRTEVVEVAYDGEPTRVEVTGVPIERCEHCGEEFSGPMAAQVKHQAICRALGLLDPKAIRELREQLKLTQAELSRLTGIGEATISRWERGRLLQNRAMDRFLRLVANDPKNVSFLKRLGSSPETGPTATDLNVFAKEPMIQRFRQIGGVSRAREQEGID